MKKNKGRPPGGKKFGGRVAGTPNLPTKKLLEDFQARGINIPEKILQALERLKQLNELPEITAANKIQIISIEMNVMLDLMAYVYPKRKPVDEDGSSDDAIEVDKVYKSHWGNKSEPTD